MAAFLCVTGYTIIQIEICVLVAFSHSFCVSPFTSNACCSAMKMFQMRSFNGI